ncbi:MAG: hypothetical protein AAF960_19975 [Bacteroidota bacterium]
MNTLFSVAEIELTYKSKVKPCDRPQITSPKQSYDILLHNWSDQLEVGGAAGELFPVIENTFPTAFLQTERANFQAFGFLAI